MGKSDGHVKKTIRKSVGKFYRWVMKVKITQRDIPTLEDGTYTIGQSVYLRKRGNYANFFCAFRLTENDVMCRLVQPEISL